MTEHEDKMVLFLVSEIPLDFAYMEFYSKAERVLTSICNRLVLTSTPFFFGKIIISILMFILAILLLHTSSMIFSNISFTETISSSVITNRNPYRKISPDLSFDS